VADRGVVPDGLDRRHLVGEWSSDHADEDHAVIAPDQPSVRDAMRDRVVRQPRIEERASGHDALRPRRARHDPTIDR